MVNFKVGILTAIFIFQSVSLFAQDTTLFFKNGIKSNHQCGKIGLRGYSVLLIQDFVEQATSPFSMNKKQIINLGSFALVTAGLIIIDAPIDKYANSIRKNNLFIHQSSPFITRFGADYAIYTTGIIECYGLLFKDDRAQATALLASQAMITSGVWTRVGKILTGRERPSASYTKSLEEGGSWHGPTDQFRFDSDKTKLAGSNYDAFPSGHTATAFSVATVFAKMYADKPIIPLIAYSAATAVGLSRTTEHSHWMSDVVVGAALGYLCGTQVVNNYRKLYRINSKQNYLYRLSLNLNNVNGIFVPELLYTY